MDGQRWMSNCLGFPKERLFGIAVRRATGQLGAKMSRDNMSMSQASCRFCSFMFSRSERIEMEESSISS